MAHDTLLKALWIWGLCLLIIAPVAAVVSTHAASRKRRRFWKYVLWALFSAPIVLLSFSYPIPQVLFVFGIPALISGGIYFGYTKPAEREKSEKVRAAYMAAKLEHTNPALCFDPSTASIVLTDREVNYVEGVVPFVSFRRLCKNPDGEYFLVEADEAGVSVKHLTLEKAKNSIRHNSIAFRREFGAKNA